MLQADTSKLLKETSRETKSLLNKLSRIVITEETLHRVLQEGVSPVLEVLGNDQLNLKIRLKDKNPPLTIFVKNYDEIHEWLAPKGVLASPCLLEMLEVRGPQVFEPCPAPELVERTVTSLSPAKTCPGPRGRGTSGDPLSHQRTKRHDGRRAYF